MSARDQGPAGAPRRRCGHAPASFSFPRSLSVSQTLSFSLCPVGHHGYSSWPPFTASSSSSSGRRRWPLCLEPLHPLHRAGALARAQAPGRRPRVSLPDLDLAGRRSHDKADPAASRASKGAARAAASPWLPPCPDLLPHCRAGERDGVALQRPHGSTELAVARPRTARPRRRRERDSRPRIRPRRPSPTS